MALVEHFAGEHADRGGRGGRLLNGPAVDWEHTQRERRKKKKR